MGGGNAFLSGNKLLWQKGEQLHLVLLNNIPPIPSFPVQAPRIQACPVIIWWSDCGRNDIQRLLIPGLKMLGSTCLLDLENLILGCFCWNYTMWRRNIVGNRGPRVNSASRAPKGTPVPTSRTVSYTLHILAQQCLHMAAAPTIIQWGRRLEVSWDSADCKA